MQVPVLLEMLFPLVVLSRGTEGQGQGCSVPELRKVGSSAVRWGVVASTHSGAGFGFVVVQSLSCVQLFETPWTAALQAPLSFTISQSLLKLTSIESAMPSCHLILCCPLLLLPSIFPCIRVFSNRLALRIRWLKYWSFSFSISPSNKYPGLISL